MSSINNIWDKIFEYWQIHEPNFLGCNGATDKEILEFEKYLEFKLPDDFKESLKRCSAYPSEPNKALKSSCSLTGGAGKLMPIKEIFSFHQDFKEYMYDGGVYGQIDPKIIPQDIVWSQEWIPIYSWNCDIFILLDLRKNYDEQYGQVLYLDQEYDTLGIWANSYEEFLQSLADTILDHGAFNHDDMKKVINRINDETRSK